MSEMKLSDLQALAGSYAPTSFMGGYIAGLLGLHVPGLDEQDGAYHHKMWIDHLESLTRRLANAFQGYVYKDDTDTALQFSLTAFNFVWRGMAVSYAGAVNLGPVSAGAERKIWADLSDITAVTIGVGTAWPAVPHIRMATITAPASGHWTNDHIVRYPGRQALVPDGGLIYPIYKTWSYTQAPSVTIGTVPSGARILRRSVYVDTGLVGTGPSLKLGDDGDNERLIAAAAITHGTPGVYPTEQRQHYQYGSQTAVKLYIGGSGLSAGAGLACVEYVT